MHFGRATRPLAKQDAKIPAPKVKVGAINFGLPFAAWQKLSLRKLVENTELRVFLGIVVAVTGIETAMLAYTSHTGLGEGFRLAFLHVISCITSTGFTTTDFSLWPLFLPTLLVFVGFVGGCGGSTVGGIKVLRVVLLFRNSLLEARKLLHPRLFASVKLGNRVVPQRIMDSRRYAPRDSSGISATAEAADEEEAKGAS